MRGKFPCPTCGERSAQKHSTSTYIVAGGIIRMKCCPREHEFVTIELPIEFGSLTWNEIQARIQIKGVPDAELRSSSRIQTGQANR